MPSNAILEYAIPPNTVTDIKQYRTIKNYIEPKLKPVAEYVEKLKLLNSATTELNDELNDILTILIYDLERRFERFNKTFNDLYEKINLDLENDILNIALELFPNARNLTTGEIKKEEDFERQNFKIIEI